MLMTSGAIESSNHRVKRLLLIAGVFSCVLFAYAGANIAMDRVARWVEVKQDGYLWWREEWMQLFDANNFVGRGRGRVLLAGSSEVREGFLFDEFEDELPGLDVRNGAISNNTLEILLIVLRYLETAYGEAAMPEKIVLGVTPLFLLGEPSVDRSYLPRVINRYSPSFHLDTGVRPARLIRKGQLDSLIARSRYLRHQSRRYKGALRGVMRTSVLSVAPELADRYWLRFGLVPSIYHHLAPVDPNERLEALRRALPSPPDPADRAATVRAQWMILRAFTAEHSIDLYVVNMPQSTFLRHGYWGGKYGEYEQLLRSLTTDVHYLDLADVFRDDAFYDMTHLRLAAARQASKRVAQFVRESEWSER
jgi:hypothetical protein